MRAPGQADGEIHLPAAFTDFAVMFLPTEGLYAEVLRRPGLFESLARPPRVNVAGPTTLLAILNEPADGLPPAGDREALQRDLASPGLGEERVRQVRRGARQGRRSSTRPAPISSRPACAAAPSAQACATWKRCRAPRPVISCCRRRSCRRTTKTRRSPGRGCVGYSASRLPAAVPRELTCGSGGRRRSARRLSPRPSRSRSACRAWW